MDMENNKYLIVAGNEVLGTVKFAKTQKGDRWLLCLYADDSTLRYRDFDAAYAAAYKKKPAGSLVINANTWSN